VSDAPLLTHALPGFRTWMLDRTGALVPYTGQTGPWSAGVNTARCARGAAHVAPATDCSCGIYAFHHPSRRLTCEPFVGAIAAWGDMEIHRDGFRAQHAVVLALAGARTPALTKAAERYGVPIVPRSALQPLAALLTGTLPVSLVDLPPHGSPDWLARRRGYSAEHQVWAEPSSGTVTIGVSPALLAWLRDGVQVDPQPPREDRHVPVRVTGGGGAIELPPLVRGAVTAVNPAPEPCADDPEGGCWIARIAPSDWEADCHAFTWGRAGRTAMITEAQHSGTAAWEHLRVGAAGEPGAISSWRDVRAMLLALREAPPPPRFADAAQLYDEVAIPLGQAMARDRSLTRLDMVLAFTTTGPDARLVLDLRRDAGALHTGRGPVADVEVTLSADDLLATLCGRIDLARESRTGRLRVRGSLAHALSCLAVVANWSRRRLPGVTDVLSG
jgi:glycine cleavage system H lipoate-binding protein